MRKELLIKRKFLERAKFVHDEQYDYSLVKYRGANKQVEIICREHGIFKLTPSQHLSGKGCPYCKDHRLTREEFLSKIKVLYNDLLDCTKSTYTHETRKTEYITVTCKVHGDFLQKVDALLNGIGCRKCAKEARRNRTLSGNVFSAPDTTLLEIEEDNTITFPVVIRFKTHESKVEGYLWTVPFATRLEAEKSADDLKLCLETTDFNVLESIIFEKKQKYLDIENAAKLIKWLNLESYDSYVTWWDLYRPSFIPRNLVDYYSNYDKLFGSDEVGIVVSILNRIRLSDNDEEQRA